MDEVVKAEGNKQRKPMEEEPNGGEAGDNERDRKSVV